MTTTTRRYSVQHGYEGTWTHVGYATGMTARAALESFMVEQGHEAPVPEYKGREHGYRTYLFVGQSFRMVSCPVGQYVI
jgi:hypothetical protein